MKWQISGSKVTQTKWIQKASRPCKLAVGKTQQPHYISVYYVLPMFTRHIIITTTLIISLADRQLSQIKQTQQRSKSHKMNNVTYRSPLKGRKLPNILCMFGKKPEHAKFVSYSTVFFFINYYLSAELLLCSKANFFSVIILFNIMETFRVTL